MNVVWEFAKSTFKTKNFIFNAVVYGLAIILTTIYCYARLDAVRTQAKSNQITEKSQ